MRASWLTLVVAIYVFLDVSNPFMPGALAFGVESSIEARQADRFRALDEIVGMLTAAPTPRHLERVEPRDTMISAPAPDVIRVWHRPVRYVRPSSLTVPSLAPEDD